MIAAHFAQSCKTVVIKIFKNCKKQDPNKIKTLAKLKHCVNRDNTPLIFIRPALGQYDKPE